MLIFISYRRDDTVGITGRILDWLQRHFGTESVFRDVDSVPLGVDFRHHIDNILCQCNVLLAVIGQRWLSAEDRGRRRLEDPADFVRIELETALRLRIRIIPVLVEGTLMPKPDQLPTSLLTLAF